jgi:membrane protein required for colicin V production
MWNGADIVLGLVMLVSAAVGLWRGLIAEVLSLVVWVAAFWVAFVYGEAASALFRDAVDSPAVRLLLGYAALFLVAVLIGGLATWLIGRLVKASGLSAVDRLRGIGFGIVRGAALCCVLVLLLGFTRLPRDPWWQQSALLPAFEPGAQWLRGWLPDAVAQHVRFDVPALPQTLPEMEPTPAVEREPAPQPKPAG